MGVRISLPDRPSKQRSVEIDRILQEDKQKAKHECKILILGSGGSGKTTIVKQMKSNHDGFSDAELTEYRPVIYKNVLDSANAVVLHMKKIGLECVEVANRPLVEKIIQYHFDLQNNPPHVSAEIAETIHQLWKDPIITKIMDEHSSEFYLIDSAHYFFSEVLRIAAPGYLPNETDILHAHREGMGIIETRVETGQISLRMFDVMGQQAQLRKWIHCFENIDTIIFCVGLDEYDLVSPDEQWQNRMLESLALFESIVNSRWFLRTSIILILNKMDLFKKKLPKVPLQQYFPEYTGGLDFNKASKYILWKFMQVNRARLPVYPHLTEMSDPTHLRLVFAVAKENIMQKTIRRLKPL